MRFPFPVKSVKGNRGMGSIMGMKITHFEDIVLLDICHLMDIAHPKKNNPTPYTLNGKRGTGNGKRI
jgi:hypothetical protein